MGTNNPPHLVANKLNRILQKTDQRLIFFIDGWNEADLDLARAFNNECRRLQNNRIVFVLSFTNLTARNLLIDKVGNIDFIAEASGLKNEGFVRLLEVNPERSSGDVIQIENYTRDELKKAYTQHAQVYEVEVPNDHAESNDPFLIRLAMQRFSGGVLPVSLDEPTLIQQRLQKKMLRVSEIDSDMLQCCLAEVANKIFCADAPLEYGKAQQIFHVGQLPFSLYEAALLTRTKSEQDLPAVDFYYYRDRDFVIAYWARNWNDILRSNQLRCELEKSVSTQVGQSALIWYLRQHQCYLDELLKTQNQFSSRIQIVLIRSLRMILIKEGVAVDRKQLMSTINTGLRSSDNLLKVEAAQLLIEKNDTIDESFVVEMIEQSELPIEDLLYIDAEYPFEIGSVSHIVLDALRQLHYHEARVISESESGIVDALWTAIIQKSAQSREAAIKALGYVSPLAFSKRLPTIFNTFIEHSTDKKSQNVIKDSCIIAITLAQSALEDVYWGGSDFGCPTYIDSLIDNPQSLMEEYHQVTNIHGTILTYFPKTNGLQKIIDEFNRLVHYSNNYQFIRSFLDDLIYAFDHNSRIAAAEFLGAIQYKDAVSALIEALEDRSWFVQKAAAEALWSIGTLEAISAESRWRRKQFS